MKGIIIYEDYRGKEVVEAIKLGVVNYTTSSSDGDWVSELSGIRKTSTQACCNKDDEYDFETGALIALMKMCGFDKSYTAIEEAFKYNSYDAKKSKELNILKRDNDKVKDLDVKEYYNKLSEENINLKKEKEQIIVAKNILYNNLEKENEKLEEENKELHENIDELFKSEQHTKSELGRLYFEKHRLEEENEKLKLDCEKLQHGYIDTDMIFCGGRQNGKQYTFLVELFKNLDQKKVDAAYKEAYNTTLPVWQKEVLKQMYDVYKESKEKIELHTKREQMWNDILSCGDCEHSKYVEVKKEDLEAFAKECNEKKIFSIIGYEFHLQKFWFADDRYIFQIFRKPAGFICAKCVGFAYEDTIIDYLPPMRWDLFNKGRIYVKLDAKHFDEFKQACIRELGISPKTGYFNGEMIVINIPKEERFVITRDLKGFKVRKIINWEDVR